MPAPAAASRLAIAVLVAIALLGGAMRCWQARESLWLDELHTAWCALGSLAEVTPRATLGNQSPLFFWLEWLLVQLLGPSELTVRLPSLVAGSLLPVALFCLVRRWTDATWLGILAAWLVVVDPVQIFYATEARPYALVELLAVLHVAVVAELLDEPTIGLRIAFVLGAGLLFHLHYTAGLVLIAEAFAVGFAKLTDEYRIVYRWRDLAVDLLLIALLCLPALGNLAAIYGRRQNWEAFVHPQPARAIVTLLPWSWAALVLLLAQVLRWIRSPLTSDNRPAILALSWLFVPLVLAWTATRTDVARLFFLRYLVVSAPAAVLAIVLWMRLVPLRSLQVALGIMLAVFAIAASPIARQFAEDGRFLADRRGDWRSAIAHFNGQQGHDQYPVLVATQLIEADALRGPHDPALAAYCLYPVHSLYPLAADPAITIPLPRTNPGQLSSEVQGLVRSHGAMWLIFAGNDKAADSATQMLLASLAEVEDRPGEWHVESRKSFGTVHVLFLRQL